MQVHMYSLILLSFLESQLAPQRPVSQVQYLSSQPTESTDMEITVSSHTSGTAPRIHFGLTILSQPPTVWALLGHFSHRLLHKYVESPVWSRRTMDQDARSRDH